MGVAIAALAPLSRSPEIYSRSSPAVFALSAFFATKVNKRFVECGTRTVKGLSFNGSSLMRIFVVSGCVFFASGVTVFWGPQPARRRERDNIGRMYFSFITVFIINLLSGWFPAFAGMRVLNSSVFLC